MSDLSNRVVMITGAVGNLGQAVAEVIAAAGANLALVDRATDRLPAMFPNLIDSPRCLFLTGVDVGSAESCAAAAEKTLARFGRIDALINTVGAFRGGKPVHESDPGDWSAMFDANVGTTLNACRAVIPAMIRQKFGKIVNVASIAALRGDAGVAAYSAAKTAVARLTESLSAELRPFGINVNCVLPATLDTPQNRKAMPDANVGNWVRLPDLAAVIAFLASDGARAIHGGAIPVIGSA